MMKRIHMISSGRVQGVGYRASILSQSRGLNLKGYVKNMPDGTVEIVAEGGYDELKQLIDIAKAGSYASSVKEVTTEYSPATGEFSEFGIKY